MEKEIFLLFIEEYDNQPSKLIGVYDEYNKAEKCLEKDYFNCRGYILPAYMNKKI